MEVTDDPSTTPSSVCWCGPKDDEVRRSSRPWSRWPPRRFRTSRCSSWRTTWTQRGPRNCTNSSRSFDRDFAECVRIVRVEGGGRARPLNVGVRQARGAYVAVLDDDDIAFAHWVEEFQRAASEGPGSVVRAVVAEQSVEWVPGVVRPAIRHVEARASCSLPGSISGNTCSKTRRPSAATRSHALAAPIWDFARGDTGGCRGLGLHSSGCPSLWRDELLGRDISVSSLAEPAFPAHQSSPGRMEQRP